MSVMSVVRFDDRVAEWSPGNVQREDILRPNHFEVRLHNLDTAGRRREKQRRENEVRLRRDVGYEGRARPQAEGEPISWLLEGGAAFDA